MRGVVIMCGIDLELVKQFVLSGVMKDGMRDVYKNCKTSIYSFCRFRFD